LADKNIPKLATPPDVKLPEIATLPNAVQNALITAAKEEIKSQKQSNQTKLDINVEAKALGVSVPIILPNNPLYPLKVARDRLILFLISGPLKKAEFELLQADKRINAAYYLAKKEREKDELVESTVSKAENYLEASLVDTYKLKAQGKDVKDISSRIYLATKKHQSIIKSLAQNAKGAAVSKLAEDEKRVKDLEKKAFEIAPK